MAWNFGIAGIFGNFEFFCFVFLMCVCMCVCLNDVDQKAKSVLEFGTQKINWTCSRTTHLISVQGKQCHVIETDSFS